MTDWPVFSNLRLRFVLLALLGVLPALALLLYTASEQRDQAITDAQDEARRFVRLAASDQERLIESSNQLLAVVARFPELRADDITDCQRLLSTFIEEYPVYANIGVIEPDGVLRCSAIPTEEDVDLGDRPYFQRALETGSFAAGDFQIGRITNQATINVAFPTLDDTGNVVEVIYAAIDLAALNEFASESELPEDSFLLVLDRNGTVLVRHPEPEPWVGESLRGTPVVETILADESGFAETKDADGRDYLFVYTPLIGSESTSSAYVVLAQPREIVLATANRTFNRHLGRLGVVSILALVAAWVGADVFARRGPATRKRLVGRLYDTFNSGDTGDLDDILAPGFIDNHPNQGQTQGVDGMRELIAQFRAAFPDGMLVADEMVVDGHTVVAWVTLTGTHMGEFSGVPPTGIRVQARGIETFKLLKGKIAESWSVFGELQPFPDSMVSTPVPPESVVNGSDSIDRQ